jgi:DNA-binding NarL/FixJ family response regulator
MIEMSKIKNEQLNSLLDAVHLVKVAILDEQPLFRLGLSSFLKNIPGFSVLIDTGFCSELLSDLPKYELDLVIMDIAFNGQSDMEIIREIRHKYFSMPILVLSDFEEVVFAKQVVRAGANGYVMKHSTSEIIKEALNTILEGKTYLSDRVYNILLGEVMNQQNETSDTGVDKLSSREFQVFLLMGKGLQPKEITDSLRLSRGTVEYDRKIMLKKLNLINLKQLRDFALSWVRSNRINCGCST